jgi:hypothetical protein
VNGETGYGRKWSCIRLKAYQYLPGGTEENHEKSVRKLSSAQD